MGIGEDCEPTSASRIGTYTIERSDDELAVARHGLMQVYFRPDAAVQAIIGGPLQVVEITMTRTPGRCGNSTI